MDDQVNPPKKRSAKVPTFLTPEEAAALLTRPVGTINRWRAEGRGPRYFKLGGRIRYDEADLLAYIAECSHDPSVRA
ncbi:helix-turn-helix domain-containing protein [Granulicella sp. L56]|uniref:helix-turn-helix transcriptional regulator n=1 Tax=Acidobacteriaceae TaxID=204434 RepID=UPI00131A778C